MKKSKHIMMKNLLISILFVAIGIALGTLFCAGVTGFETFSNLIDLPTILLILVLALPNLFICGLWKDFLRTFQLGNPDQSYTLSELNRSLEAVTLLQKQLAYSGILVAFMGVIMALRQLDDLAVIGPCLAVVCLSAFYTAMFEIIIMPLYVQTKKCIIDYMEEDES